MIQQIDRKHVLDNGKLLEQPRREGEKREDKTRTPSPKESAKPRRAKKASKRSGKGSRPEETDKDRGDPAGAHEPEP